MPPVRASAQAEIARQLVGVVPEAIKLVMEQMESMAPRFSEARG